MAGAAHRHLDVKQENLADAKDTHMLTTANCARMKTADVKSSLQLIKSMICDFKLTVTGNRGGIVLPFAQFWNCRGRGLTPPPSPRLQTPIFE